MAELKFSSVFADELTKYVNKKVSLGFKQASFRFLKRFDKYCLAAGLNAPVFSQDLCDLWMIKEENESHSTYYARVNNTNLFLEELYIKGYRVSIPHKIKFKSSPFRPHIYTDDEIRRYFRAVDLYEDENQPHNAIQYPIIFRLLYCCGARIGEVLNIRKKNVDLEDGIIELQETKNGETRYIVLNQELRNLLLRYAEKCFYLYKDDDYIFTNSRGKPIDERRIHDRHVEFLYHADIPYYGGGLGPRVHDWRHTFAVKAFKKLSDEGADLYVCLPILSVYLGHKTIMATEKYLRMTAEVYPEICQKLEETINFVLESNEHEID